MKHALITAGHKGIGKKVTEQFLKKQYSVTVHFRSDKNKVRELQEEWHQYSDNVQFIEGDITNKEDIEHVVAQAMEQFGRIDVLINNAGPYVFERKKLIEYTDSEWYEMVEGNLSSVFHFVKAVVPIMKNQQFGRIITYGFQDVEHTPGWMYRAAFSAAKSGLASLTKSLALEVAEYGITANMVCPGDIVGDMKENDIIKARLLEDKATPVGRSGTGEDIARIIEFLCDENSDMITGSTISASGGVDVVHKSKKQAPGR
ncbi:SDR family oxidoreductase [Priestia megaterium]|uniref:SDR family oxidoreductase n=1 Tax=Priestia megaterium TaxID=1404 RepID=UPI00145513B1|nr:SDR family oxidoreductase [Priestia megaterium]